MIAAALHKNRLQRTALRAALDEPHIAQVVDVFKGAIVDIKHHTTPPAQE